MMETKIKGLEKFGLTDWPISTCQINPTNKKKNVLCMYFKQTNVFCMYLCFFGLPATCAEKAERYS